MSPRRFSATRSRRSGFTLLEVAVALVIFVIGALSIIQLFPPGLALVRSSGERTSASALNSGTLSRLANEPDLIPDGIYDAGGYGGAVVGSSRKHNALPTFPIGAVESEFANSALDRFLSVTGERHTVPTSGEPYLLTRASYEDVRIYREDEVEDVTVDANGVLNFANARLKSSGARIVVTPGETIPGPNFRYQDGTTVNDTLFYVSYRYTSSAGAHMEGALDEPFKLLTTETACVPLGAAADTDHKVIPGLVKVRMRQFAAQILSTDTTPTQADRNAGYIKLTDVAGLTINTGEKLSLDYTVKDWRWITYDALPGAEAPDTGTQVKSQLALPLTPLNDDLNLYCVARYDNGTAVTASDSTTLGTGVGQMTEVKPKSGTLDFLVDTTARPVALRVAYRTLDNWTHQLSVASRSYKPVTAATLTTRSATAEPWRNYYSDDGTLYFKPTEVGKAVYVSYAYLNGTTIVPVHRKLLTIQANQIDRPTSVPVDISATSATGPNQVVAKLELTDNTGTPLSAANFHGVTAVEGASLMARTAWINGNSYNQTSSISYRRSS